MNRFLILGPLLLAIIILPKFIGQKVTPTSAVLVNAETSWRLPKEEFNSDLTGDATASVNPPADLESSPPTELETTVKTAADGAYFAQTRARLGQTMWPVQQFFQQHRLMFLGLNLAFFLLVLIGVAMAVAFQRFTMARRLAEKSFRLGSIEVLLVCIITVLAHVGGLNFLAGVHYLIWLVPVICVLLFAGILRLIDMNYPIWNETFASVCLPVLSAVLILEWGRIAALLKRISIPKAS